MLETNIRIRTEVRTCTVDWTHPSDATQVHIVWNYLPTSSLTEGDDVLYRTYDRKTYIGASLVAHDSPSITFNKWEGDAVSSNRLHERAWAHVSFLMSKGALNDNLA